MNKKSARILKTAIVYAAFALAILFMAFLSVWIGNSSAKVGSERCSQEYLTGKYSSQYVA